MSFQNEKQVVLDHIACVEVAETAELSAAFAAATGPDYRWRGVHPFDTLNDPAEVARKVWLPLRQAFTSLRRRQDVFLAGRNETDGFASVWVVSMGHLVGLFDAPWLGIPPTGKMVFLRTCEFHKVIDGQIVETAFFCDIPHLMMQAGLQPFAPQTAAHLVQPGPWTHDGVLRDAQPPEEGETTLALINAMIRDLGTWQSGLPLEQELARTWHDDMIWWGPAGIGATMTIARYAQQHSAPFRAAFAERSQTTHLCRLAEGHYGGFFGWPNFSAQHKGGFMGMPGSETRGEMRVIDIYRREGNKLAENWIFIDLLHFWKGLGVDILGRIAEVPRT